VKAEAIGFAEGCKTTLEEKIIRGWGGENCRPERRTSSGGTDVALTAPRGAEMWAQSVGGGGATPLAEQTMVSRPAPPLPCHIAAEDMPRVELSRRGAAMRSRQPIPGKLRGCPFCCVGWRLPLPCLSPTDPLSHHPSLHILTRVSSPSLPLLPFRRPP
jgi:hypothetical protein